MHLAGKLLVQGALALHRTAQASSDKFFFVQGIDYIMGQKGGFLTVSSPKVRAFEDARKWFIAALSGKEKIEAKMMACLLCM